MNSSTGRAAVRSRLLLLLLVHIGAPLGAQRVSGARRVRLQPPSNTGRPEGTESIPLDLTPVEAKADDFLVLGDGDMRLHLLRNHSATCNDGSPAGYYIRESKNSKRWLLFLEGGWYCFSNHTCDDRMKKTRALMSSSPWPRTRKGMGILSPKPEENPDWWNANIVYIPYCSSDMWTGTRPKTEDSDYAFLGTLIIKEVVNELLPKGLDKAEVLLLAGTSAGAVGVLVNVDRVQEQLRSQGHRGVQVRGLSDSGWLLERKQYKPGSCKDVLTCGPLDLVKLGFEYWRAGMPEACRQIYMGAEWRCFHGPNIYPTIKGPTFVMQWLFDLAQLTLTNAAVTGPRMTESHWNYIHSLGQEMKNTLQKAKAPAFAPACLAHGLITQSSWMDVQVGGTSLPNALHCWERSLQEKRRTPAARGCLQGLVDSCLRPNCNPTCPDLK